MKNLSITLLQQDLVWQNKQANFDLFARVLSERKTKTDLAVLPEMFTTGFTMEAITFAETMEGDTVKWMLAQAKQTGAVLTGSAIIKEGEQYYNRLLWATPDGSLQWYDKRHLFRMAGEDKYYAPGAERRIFSLNGFSILPQVCYDLRFPVWSRRTKELDYDLLLYVANWPEKRNHAWKILLQARAIENQCYVAGLNRIGTDDNGINYSGDSAVIDFKGESCTNIAPGIAQSETILLDKSELDRFRTGFPASLDADDFYIKLAR